MNKGSETRHLPLRRLERNETPDVGETTSRVGETVRDMREDGHTTQEGADEGSETASGLRYTLSVIACAKRRHRQLAVS